MGKNRITEEEAKKAPAKAASKPVAEGAAAEKGAAQTASSKKRVDSAVLYVQSTYNNTKVLLADTKGNALCWSSSGSLGFKGAKKGTPFAAAKIGEVIGDNCILVSDATATPAMAQDLIKKIRTISDKPIKYVLLTHYHAVRVLGASAFVAEGATEIDVVVNGVGSGRESSIRSILTRGIALRSIKDVTPVPHNGPKPKKPRRV